MSRIYLIAGHHKNDPGAVSFHESLGGRISEAELTIELRDLIYHYFKQHNDTEVVVDNDNHTLQQVLNEINKTVKKEDLIVDIHFNAFNTKATGTEVLIPTIHSKMEKQLGENICKSLSDIMNIPNRGIKTEKQSHRTRIAILHGTGHRVLLEICFKDNPVDMKSYQVNKHLVAQQIALEIEKIISNL